MYRLLRPQSGEIRVLGQNLLTISRSDANSYIANEHGSDDSIVTV